MNLSIKVKHFLWLGFNTLSQSILNNFMIVGWRFLRNETLCYLF